jgi:hypothetical protein
MASTYLQRTFGSSATNLNKMTFSFWTKVCNSSLGRMFSTDTADAQQFWIKLGSGKLNVVDYGYGIDVNTNRLFRDVSAWYHIVVSIDTTQSTASDRVKIYVNGVQETSFSTATYPSQNATVNWNGNNINTIGNKKRTTNENFDGLMSHVHFIDGTAYAPTAFGSTDSTTGEWQINTSPSVTYGTNGFFILKDGNTITDSSPNSNNWTLGGGTLSKSEDNPSNVFCTLNPLDVMKQSGGIYVPTFSNGNTTMSASATNNYQTFGSIAVDTGKYYWEMKVPNYDANLGARIGLFHGDNKSHSGSYYYGADGYNVHQNGSIYTNGSSTTYMAGFSNNIIITFALDKTNGLSYVGANGYWADGNGNTNQSFANAVAVETKLSTTMPDKTTYAMFDVYGSTTQHINFGNGYFGTTAVSSAGTNASGNGIFEYDVPTGYTALSTKGLNT